MYKRLIVILLSVVCLLALANTLEASPLRNYWGDAATEVRIGKIHPYGTYVAMKRESDGRCAFYRIGGLGGLDDNYTFFSGDGSDRIFLGRVSAVDFCGYTIGDLPYDGHFFDVHGEGGNDWIAGRSSGDSWLHGDDGDDHIEAANYPGARVYGGPGNDDIYGADPANNELLYGGPGNDALCDACFDYSKAALIDGGSGTDCSQGNADTMVSIESSNCGDRCYYLY